MKDMYIIDNCIDEREFRNYVLGMLIEKGYTKWQIDDARVSDDDPINDNDILVKSAGMTYTVQTFLNTEITEDEIDETVQDIDKENVEGGILITNTIVSEEMKNYGRIKGVKVMDRSFFV